MGDENKMSALGALGMGAAGNAVGGLINEGMGLLFQGMKNRQQLKQAGKLQELQIKGQKELTEFNRNQQMQIWRDTNYPAQMEQMKLAGLNPGLMYGMGGGGGVTANVSTGSVSGQPAQTATRAGGGEGMGMSAALMAAQIRNIEANTQETLSRIPGNEKEPALKESQTANYKAQEELTRVDAELRKVQASVARQTIVDQMTAIENVAKEGTERIKQLQLSQDETKARIDLIKKQTIVAVTENALKESDINVNKAQIEKMAADILQGWVSLSIQERQQRINKATAEFNINHPGVMNALGGAIQRIADEIAEPSNERTIK